MGISEIVFISLFLSNVTIPGGTNEVNVNEIHCLAQNVYHESRGEPLIGKVFVAQITMNRVKHKKYPNTICDVVKQSVKWKGHPVRHKCQFSWYCDGKSDRIRNAKAWEDAVEIAGLVYLNLLTDFTSGATHFYNPKKANPKWARAKNFEPLMIDPKWVGEHRFYVMK